MINKSNTSSMLSNIPFTFEKNIGQFDDNVKFVLKNNGSITFFTKDEVVIVLNQLKEKNVDNQVEKLNKIKEYETSILRVNLENSNQVLEIIGVNELNCKINYLKGKDKNDWTMDVPIYEKIIYKNIYDGIDLVYYENQGKLEHDFIVNPKANIKNIKMSFDGADKIYLDEDGNISINIKEHIVQILKPKVYQYIEEVELEISSYFIIDNNYLTFNISDYNKNEVLIIDPVLMYGSYIGGNSYDVGTSIAIDNNENAYITGQTYSSNFPIKNAYQSTLQGNSDVFIVKIDTKLSGVNSLIYSTYIGGSDYDSGNGIAVDNNENAYITGSTTSTNFPIKNAYQSTLQGNYDAFIVKIDTKLSGANSLIYSTYIGGTNSDYGKGIAVDNSENTYITGQTYSSNFPVKNAYQSTLQGANDAFIVKIDTKLSGVNSLIYSTYIGGTNIGGTNYNYGNSIAVDNNENAYITGLTTSTNFPIKNAYQSILQGSSDVFLVKVDTKLSGVNSLIYSTYIGGSDPDEGRGVVVDSNENAYIVGDTLSIDFPVKNAYQSTLQGENDIVLIKIDTKLSGANSLIYSTYIGGSNRDYGYGIEIDSNENAYLTGNTSSIDFPIKYAYQKTLSINTTIYPESIDAFLVKVDTKLSGVSSLVYSTYIGSYNSDYGNGIAVDSNKNAYIVGYTNSTHFPVANAYQSTLQGNYDAFIVKLNTLLCDLILEKSSNKCIIKVGEKLIYTLKIINNGPDISSNVIITDSIDNSFTINTLQASLGNIQNVGNTVTWTIPTLNISQQEVATIEVLATNQICNTCIIENIATATCDNNIINPNNATDKTVISIDCKPETFTDLQLRKTAPKKTFLVGEPIPFTVKVKNNGPDIATNLITTDMVDARFSIISLQTLSGTISQTGNLVVWKIPSLAVGTEAVAIITVTAQIGVSNVSIANSVSVVSDDILINPNNSKDAISVYISN